MEIKEVAGEVTDYLGARGTDLGYLRWDDNRGCLVGLFGDTFPKPFLQTEQERKSPVIICYDRDYNILGTPQVFDDQRIISANSPVRKLWEYPNNNPEFSTVLPTDFIKIGEWWYVHVMVTQGLGNEKWTEFQRSRDLVHWEHTGKYISPADSRCTMQTFEQMGEWIYIFGTGGLARDKPIYLWRNRAESFPHGPWEAWGWNENWQWGNNPTPVFEGKYGEICVRQLKDGLAFAYFDAGRYRCEVKYLKSPTANFYDAPTQTVCRGEEFPQCYCPSISPISSFRTSLDLFVSQWITSKNDPYHVVLFRQEWPSFRLAVGESVKVRRESHAK